MPAVFCYWHAFFSAIALEAFEAVFAGHVLSASICAQKLTLATRANSAVWTVIVVFALGLEFVGADAFFVDAGILQVTVCVCGAFGEFADRIFETTLGPKIELVSAVASSADTVASRLCSTKGIATGEFIPDPSCAFAELLL